MKTVIWKDTCTPIFIAALFTITKSWNQPKWLLTEEWIKKMWYIYTIKYYSSIKKNDIIPFAVKWMKLMDLEMIMYLPGDSVVKNPPTMLKTRVWSLGREDPLEEEMSTHSRIPAWRIPWTEEPGGLQFMKFQRVRYNWMTDEPPPSHPSRSSHSTELSFLCFIAKRAWFLT